MSRLIPLTTGLALTALMPTPAIAESDPELVALVQAQAETIRRLEARLAVVEGALGARASTEVDPGHAAVAPPAAAPRPASGPAQPVEQTAVSALDWSGGAPVFGFGDLRFKPRGRILTDASSTWGSRHDDRNIAGTEMRAARLGFEGQAGDQLTYVVEADFSDNTVGVRSANIELSRRLRGLDASLTLGQRLNDRGMDGSTGLVSLPFVERNAVGAAIAPQRGSFGLGVTGRLAGPGWHASLSLTGEDLSGVGDNDDILTWMTRAHWNPLRSDAATVHLGGWAFHETFPEDTASISRSLYVAGHFNDQVRVTTGALAAPSHGVGLGLEAGLFGEHGWVYAEAGERTVSGISSATGDIDQNAWSVAAGLFLTGERPGYAARTGTLARPKIEHPVLDGGAGAWEIAGRYDAYDFTDFDQGGEASAVTLGLNWYWSNQLRFMLDTTFWRIDNRSGAFSGADDGVTVLGRSQFTF
ncbi:OprO/OprP family phosphate-selective porin [Brevundimonas sp.]|jgi:phosphate-selective porin OprO/OprP|uniref:OprO/OprP family phosphate-selective porin n=1 Tax=Brevundimonas sp. TaxID=1871086 RepID=UPI0037BFD050